MNLNRVSGPHPLLAILKDAYAEIVAEISPCDNDLTAVPCKKTERTPLSQIPINRFPKCAVGPFSTEFSPASSTRPMNAFVTLVCMALLIYWARRTMPLLHGPSDRLKKTLQGD